MAPVLWDINHPGIFIDADVGKGSSWDFFGKANEALNSIRAQTIGKALLRSLSARCAFKTELTVTIVQTGTGNSAGAVDWSKVSAKKTDGSTPLKFMAGEGTSCTVNFNPDRLVVDGKQRPPFIGLAHELIHGYHILHGAMYRSPTGNLDNDSGLAEEEMRTVGLKSYTDEDFTENKIRKENSLPTRTNYSGRYFNNVTNSWDDA